jgi:hypothetical protein
MILQARSSSYYRAEHSKLAPFVPRERLQGLLAMDNSPKARPQLAIGPREPYIKAQVRTCRLATYSLGPCIAWAVKPTRLLT